MKTYSEIWEQNGRWLTGPNLLASIVEFLKGKSVIAIFGDNPSAVTITLPLPEIRDEISGEMVSIFWMVPEEQRKTFLFACDNILSRRGGDATIIRHTFLEGHPFPATAMLLAQINNELMRLERRGGWELWKVAAVEFGLNPYALPRPLL